MKNFKQKIQYWFFLIVGMLGVSFQMYQFFTEKIDFSWPQIGVTAFFSVLIFKPTVLVDLFNSIAFKVKK